MEEHKVIVHNTHFLVYVGDEADFGSFFVRLALSSRSNRCYVVVYDAALKV